MVSEPILARLLGHPLSGRYWTILKQYSPTRELRSLGVRSVLEIKPTLQANFVRLS